MIGARHLRQGPLADRRLPRRARPAARLGDGEGDHDARARARSGRCSSPPATRCSRSRTATSSRRRSASSTCWSRSTSTSTTPPSTPTTCCRRRRSSSARTSRSPFLALFTTPFIQMTEAVVEPSGEARQEWEIIEEIAAPDRRRALERARAAAARQGRASGSRRGGWSTCCCAPGPKGDLFGLRRGGLSLEKLRRAPARDRARRAPRGRACCAGSSATEGKRVRLDPPEILAEVERLRGRRTATTPSSRCG